MLTENLMHKWYNLKRETLRTHRSHSPALTSALSSFGVNKELTEYESIHKLNFITIENKWDFKFDCWLDIVEKNISMYKPSQLDTIINNFANKFYNDIIKEFPKKELILNEE